MDVPEGQATAGTHGILNKGEGRGVGDFGGKGRTSRGDKSSCLLIRWLPQHIDKTYLC